MHRIHLSFTIPLGIMLTGDPCDVSINLAFEPLPKNLRETCMPPLWRATASYFEGAGKRALAKGVSRFAFKRSLRLRSG